MQSSQTPRRLAVRWWAGTSRRGSPRPASRPVVYVDAGGVCRAVETVSDTEGEVPLKFNTSSRHRRLHAAAVHVSSRLEVPQDADRRPRPRGGRRVAANPKTPPSRPTEIMQFGINFEQTLGRYLHFLAVSLQRCKPATSLHKS